MSFGVFERGGAALRYRDIGDDPAVIFQHGLGGGEAQVAEVFPDGIEMRCVTLECRGQGGSAFGPEAQFSIAAFADDVEALADHLGIESAVVGGISMGAAIALRLAVRAPRRCRALVLARPAWMSAPAPDNMRPYAIVGDLLQRHAPGDARKIFLASDTAAMLARHAPDNLASLAGFFERPNSKVFGALLSAIARDGPGVSEDEIASLDIPTLVIGHGADCAHPLSFAKKLAALLPHAELAEITPKPVDRAAYVSEFRAALAGFLRERS